MLLIHLFYSLQHFHLVSILFCRLYKRFYILGKATATIPTTRIKEFAANTAITTYTLTNHIHVGTHQLTKIGDVVHEADTGSKHRISRILYHFRRRNIGKNDTKVIEQKRTVKSSHHFFCLFALYAYHYTVRTHKILDSSTFFQKFRITCHIKRYLYSSLLQLFFNNSFHLFSSTNRNRRLSYQYRIFFYILSELTCYSKYILKVSTTILIRRCTYGTKDNIHIIKH